MADSAQLSDELVFLPLGGCEEIGMNLNAYGYGPPHARRWILVDVGVTFGGLDTPDSGEIHLGEIRIDRLDRGALADMRLHHIGFVFQSYNLIPVLSAQENVEFVMQVQGVVAAERARMARDILREVGLEGMEDRRPAQLSGGQQQRVAVARAIVSHPDLVLADEPTANLDSVASAQLMDLFVELNQNHRTTFVIATHDKRVMAYARRQIKMQDGKIIEDVAQ